MRSDVSSIVVLWVRKKESAGCRGSCSTLTRTGQHSFNDVCLFGLDRVSQPRRCRRVLLKVSIVLQTLRFEAFGP